jgi:hypothetical protein
VKLESIQSQIQTAHSRTLPKSALAKACNYTLALWNRLTCFLDHPILELSIGRLSFWPGETCHSRKFFDFAADHSRAAKDNSTVRSPDMAMQQVGIALVLPGAAGQSETELALPAAKIVGVAPGIS